MTGFVAAMSEAPIDFYKSQMQVQIIRSKMDPAYKREWSKLMHLDATPYGIASIAMVVFNQRHDGPLSLSLNPPLLTSAQRPSRQSCSA